MTGRVHTVLCLWPGQGGPSGRIIPISDLID